MTTIILLGKLFLWSFFLVFIYLFGRLIGESLFLYVKDHELWEWSHLSSFSRACYTLLGIVALAIIGFVGFCVYHYITF